MLRAQAISGAQGTGRLEMRMPDYEAFDRAKLACSGRENVVSGSGLLAYGFHQHICATEALVAVTKAA